MKAVDKPVLACLALSITQATIVNSLLKAKTIRSRVKVCRHININFA